MGPWAVCRVVVIFDTSSDTDCTFRMQSKHLCLARHVHFQRWVHGQKNKDLIEKQHYHVTDLLFETRWNM